MSMTHLVGRAALAVALLGLVASSTSCVKTQPMTSSRSVPASEGTVRATNGENGNMNVAVMVSHLALPSRVSPDTSTYVVWIQPDGGLIQNVGMLVVNDKLEGHLNLVTPHKKFTLTVTPEANGQVSYPEHARVFTSEVNPAG